MSNSNTNIEPKFLKKLDLIELKKNNNNELTQRKLNTEFLIIKNLVLQANSSGESSILYTYNYIENNSINDYFVDLLVKLQIFFQDSKISYIKSIDDTSSNAIMVQDIFTKAEKILSVNIATYPLNNILNKALEAVKQSNSDAMTHINSQSPISSGFEKFNGVTDSNLYEYNKQKTTIINCIKIDWS